MQQERDRFEQRYSIARGEVTLFVLGREGSAWQVWLDQKDDFDGLPLGQGSTREEAMRNAALLLLESVRVLRALDNRHWVSANGRP